MNLNINKDKEMESVFIEILTRKFSTNIPVCCTYRHPYASTYMHLKEFNNLVLKYLTDKLNKGNNKEIILLGDFSIDLIKTNSNKNASTGLTLVELTLISTMNWDLSLIYDVNDVKCLHWNATLFYLHHRFEVVVTPRGKLVSPANVSNVILTVSVK